jgi:hypothetical protein
LLNTVANFKHNEAFLFYYLGDPDDTLAPPPSDTDISIAIRIKAVKSVLQQAVCKQQPVTMVMFDVKTHFR